MIEVKPFVDSQIELRKLCSSLVQSRDVNKTNAGDMQASTRPMKKRIAKKPLKLKTAA